MYCPRADFGLNNKVLPGAEFHQCAYCHSLWIPKGSIRTLAEANDAKSLAQHIMDEKTSEHFAVGTLKCPADATPMRFRSIGPVEIDLCPLCHGVWLDRGEIESLAAQTAPQPAGKSNAVVNALDTLTFIQYTAIDTPAIGAAASTLGDLAGTLGAGAADAGAALVDSAGNNLDSIGDLIFTLIGAIADAFNR